MKRRFSKREEFISGEYWRPDDISTEEEEGDQSTDETCQDRLVEFEPKPLLSTKSNPTQPAMLAIILILSLGATVGFSLLSRSSEERRPSWALYIATAAFGGWLGWRA